MKYMGFSVNILKNINFMMVFFYFLYTLGSIVFIVLDEINKVVNKKYLASAVKRP